MTMHHARLESSPRLQRLHRFLQLPGWHTTREIVMGAEVMAVNSAVAELRNNGFSVHCKQMRVRGSRVWAYRMTERPDDEPVKVAMETRKSKRSRFLAAIHARAKQVGISEADRRVLQTRTTGKDSCASMTLAELEAVLDALKASLLSPRLGLVNASADDSGPRMRRKIDAQCQALGVSKNYADGISRQMFRKPVGECDPDQLRAVIAALTKFQQRNLVG